MVSSSERTRVFISYSHKDVGYLQRLHAHLAYYERENLVDYWDDTKLSIGDAWEQKIADAIEHARICILLVSADFLASPYVADEELPRMLTRARNDGALIISVIISPSAFNRSPLSQFQAVNDAGHPLSRMGRHNREALWQDLADRVADALVKTVLVIDDDEDLRPIFKRLIEQMLPGYTVKLASDGVEGLKKITDSTPEVVILDYLMPRMDGLEVLRHIAARGDRYPVIFTSVCDFTPEGLAASTGIPVEQVVFLLKPFSPRDFGKMLRDVTRRNQSEM